MESKDKREFSGSIGVRFDTTRFKLELSPAEIYGGPPDCVRVRVNRRWHDAPGGAHLYLDRQQLAALVADLALGDVPAMQPLPKLPRNTRVYARYEQDGLPQSAITYTSTPPIRAHDGRVYVGVFAHGTGFMFLPLENVVPIKTASQARGLAREINRRADELALALEA